MPQPLNGFLLSTDVAADQPLGSGSSHVQVVADEESLPFPSNTFDLAVSSLRYIHLATLGFGSILLCCILSCNCQIMCVDMMVVYTACG